MQYDFRDTKCVHLEWFYGPFSLIRNIKIKDVIAMQVHIEKYFVCTTMQWLNIT